MEDGRPAPHARAIADGRDARPPSKSHMSSCIGWCIGLRKIVSDCRAEGNAGRCALVLHDAGSMAESEGFEPPIPFRVCRFSRPVPSTTRPTLRNRILSSFYGSWTCVMPGFCAEKRLPALGFSGTKTVLTAIAHGSRPPHGFAPKSKCNSCGRTLR